VPCSHSLMVTIVAVVLECVLCEVCTEAGTVVAINGFILREVCTKGEGSEASRMVARVGGCVLSEVHAEKEETDGHWSYNTLCSVM